MRRGTGEADFRLKKLDSMWACVAYNMQSIISLGGYEALHSDIYGDISRDGRLGAITTDLNSPKHSYIADHVMSCCAMNV